MEQNPAINYQNETCVQQLQRKRLNAYIHYKKYNDMLSKEVYESCTRELKNYGEV